MKKKCLVIGFGSAGSRHAAVLKELGHAVSVVSSRKTDQFDSFFSIEEALRFHKFDYIIICRATSDHYHAALKLKEKGFEGCLLIEKPLFEKKEYPTLNPLMPYVGYNLRFHPVIRKIHSLIQGVNLYSMHVYCGQYLPQWREKRDYRTIYSASEEMGGGVLRDLSHELDYICHLSGRWEKLAAGSGSVGNLEISSEDLFCLLLQTQKCPLISLQINYLDLCAKRQIILNGHGLSINADLINGILEVNGEKKRYDVARNFTYAEQHKEILAGGPTIACTYEQGLEVMDLIEVAQKAAQEKIWITRN